MKTTTLAALFGSCALLAQASSEANLAERQFNQADLKAKFIEQDGKKLYFIEFHDAPVAIYRGGIEGLTATSVKANRNNRTTRGKLDVNSPASRAYKAHLETQQQQFRSEAKGLLGRELNFRSDFQLALNAVTAFLDSKDVAKLRTSGKVKQLYPAQRRHLTTDTGPAFVGADKFWEGSAVDAALPTQGEGLIVGVLDTGINHTSPSFADKSDDGYDHANPWGEGVYSGDCVDNPELCNDKLIGIHHFDYITSNYPNYGEEELGLDHHGHGSHTASTAAGNRVTTPIYNVLNEASDATIAVSGVAPRANIVSYQTCNATDGCWPDAAIESIEHAIANGVDVLTYSVGGGLSSPWDDAESYAWLSAREAGIHAVTSAGNAGPNAYTGGSPGNAPWIITVAAGTHDRGTSPVTLDGFSGGDSTPAAITGKAITGAYTGPLVYAGDHDSYGDGHALDGQCLEPFPEGTFDGEIVLCKRGEIARVQKGANVRAGGAGGLILANTASGAQDLAADPHVVPAVHVSAADGEILQNWLASGEGHSASISASELISDPSVANNVAWFSSRGPNWNIDPVFDSMMTPDITAPGVAIYAANSENQPFFAEEERMETPYRFMDGTSMATPHVAGALLLMKALRPNWTPDEVHSALMMTANQAMQSENLEERQGTYHVVLEEADFFDMGAGMMRVDLAVNAGLVLDESIENYRAANPLPFEGEAGQPHTLNLASMARANCVLDCQWTRTLTAKTSTSWTVSYEYLGPGMTLKASQESFTLAAGETITLDIDASANGQSDDEWLFGNLVLTPADDGPVLRMPVAGNFVLGIAPNSVSTEVSGASGSIEIAPVITAGVEDFTYSVAGLARAEDYEGYTVDDANDDVFDVSTAESLEHVRFIVEPGTKAVFVSITSADAPDLDLFVGVDENLDGKLTNAGEWSRGGVCISGEVDSNESCALLEPAPGIYYATLHNFGGTGGDDRHVLSIATLDGDNGNLEAVIPDGIQPREAFAVTVNFDNLTHPDSAYLGMLTMGTSADAPDSIGSTMITIKRGPSLVDVESPGVGYAYAGETLLYTLNIGANTSGADRELVIRTKLPAGWQAQDNGNGIAIDGQAVSWTLTQLTDANASELVLTAVLAGAQGLATHALAFDVAIDGAEVDSVFAEEITVEGLPVALIDGNANHNASVVEGSEVSFSAVESHGPLPGDSLSYTWTQVGGPDVALNTDGASLGFTAPQVSGTQTITIELVVNNGRTDSQPAVLSLSVTDSVQPSSSGGDGGGSTGVMVLLLLAGANLARRR